MNRSFFAVGALLAGALLMASAASAASVSATLLNVPNGVDPGTDTMKINFNMGADVYNPGWAGKINWTGATSTDWSSGLNSQLQGILGTGGTFSTYCIEGTQNVYFGSSETWSYGVVALSSAPVPGGGMGATKAGEITELWDRSFSSIGSSNELAAAFQLAVWEITYDGIPTLGGVTTTAFTTGNFQASGDTTAINDAVTMLNGITGSGYANTFTLYALADNGIQDQVFAVPNGGTPPGVPLPAALPAGLALMAGLQLVRFFRRQPAN